MTVLSLDQDLQSNWRPSERQIAQAKAYFAEHPERTTGYTLHLLMHKNQGWWTRTVEVEHLEGQGVFTTRREALETLETLVADRAVDFPFPITGGYTRHYRLGEEWAVFEDVLSTANQD